MYGKGIIVPSARRTVHGKSASLFDTWRDTGVCDSSGVRGSRLDHCDSRITGECRSFCAGSKTLATIPTTAVANGNEVVETVEWDGLNCGVTENALMPTLRLVIVSEVRFHREILAEFLERDASVSVVGLYVDLAEVVALSPSLQADVVLVDGALRDGVAAARRTRQIKPDIRLIACAVRETKDDVFAWAEAGVIGYVPDTAASADLVRLIMDIHGGQQPCSGRVALGPANYSND
jgi:CheY-like chemotaxis protein